MAAIGGGGGVELIEPGGGGGAQQIARPVAAPNYPDMYARTIQAALEPAKFSWGTYVQSQELADKLQELNLKGGELEETRRRNLADEANKALEMTLTSKRYDEEARHNKATEDYYSNDLLFKEDQERETIRHNKADETRAADAERLAEKKEEHEETLRASQEADQNALREMHLEQLRTSKMENDNYVHDLGVIDKFKMAARAFGPMEHYNIEDNPELQKIYRDALSDIRTDTGKKMFAESTGGIGGLGEELNMQHEKAGFSPEAQSEFRRSYNDGVRDNPGLGHQQIFENAFNAAKRTQANVETRRGWGMSGKAMYDKAIAAGKDEATAMAAGESANEQEKAGIKSATTFTKRTDAEIAKATQSPDNPEGELIQLTGETDADFQVRQARVRKEMHELRDNNQDPQLALDKENEKTINANKTPTGTAPAGAKPGTPGFMPTPSKEQTEKAAQNLQPFVGGGSGKAVTVGTSGSYPVTKPSGEEEPAPELPFAGRVVGGGGLQFEEGQWKPSEFYGTSGRVAGAEMRMENTPWSWLYQNIQGPGEFTPAVTPLATSLLGGGQPETGQRKIFGIPISGP
jgi:hypothetical protein